MLVRLSVALFNVSVRVALARGIFEPTARGVTFHDQADWHRAEGKKRQKERESKEGRQIGVGSWREVGVN